MTKTSKTSKTKCRSGSMVYPQMKEQNRYRGQPVPRAWPLSDAQVEYLNARGINQTGTAKQCR